MFYQYGRHFNATFVSTSKITKVPSSIFYVKNDGWLSTVTAGSRSSALNSSQSLKSSMHGFPAVLRTKIQWKTSLRRILCTQRSNILTPTSSMRTFARLWTNTRKKQSKGYCFTVFRLDLTLLLKLLMDFGNESPSPWDRAKCQSRNIKHLVNC